MRISCTYGNHPLSLAPPTSEHLPGVTSVVYTKAPPWKVLCRPCWPQLLTDCNCTQWAASPLKPMPHLGGSISWWQREATTPPCFVQQ